jgi:hypothetical protein
MEDVGSTAHSSPAEGQLIALGYLQIGTGTLTVMMSLLALSQVLFGSLDMLSPARAFAHSADLFDRAIATYVVLQLTVGWVAGGLQLAAGRCCLRGRGPRLVRLASVVSLVNFPHGTVAAILMLCALGRPEISGALQARPAAC